MIKKVVIPAAGLGTRLLPATKQQPKEMLPVFVRGADGKLCLKPLIQLVFENLHMFGLREFCFVVGRGKRSIEDHFTLDQEFLDDLARKNRLGIAKEMREFYKRVSASQLIFLNQPEPTGFGDAVHLAKVFTGTEAFMVNAGDDFIVSENNSYLSRLVTVFEKYKGDAVFCVERVKDPRKYGVIQGEKISENCYRVTQAEEKPEHPKSNLAIVAIYIFSDKIYGAIEKARIHRDGETQLTDGIQHLINEKRNVYAIELDRSEKRIDLGTPDSYWAALKSLSRLNGLDT